MSCPREPLETPVKAHIRRAVPDDANAIADVHARSWPYTYDGLLPEQVIADVVAGRDRRAAWYRQILSDSCRPERIWVAAIGESVVGMAVWSPGAEDDATPETADLEAIYLDPAVIGQGIGRRLIRAVVADIAAAGFTQATLWVLDTNDRARRFYEAVGWQSDGATKLEQRSAGTLSEVRYRIDTTRAWSRMRRSGPESPIP